MLNDLDTALELIEEGEPVPLDLHTRLVSEGIDVDQLIEIHSP